MSYNIIFHINSLPAVTNLTFKNHFQIIQAFLLHPIGKFQVQWNFIAFLETRASYLLKISHSDHMGFAIF